MSHRLLKVFMTKTGGWKYFWRYRHLIDKKWVKSYSSIKAIKTPHRQPLMNALANFYPKRILELGCGPGANLYLCSLRFPDAFLVGMDISPVAIAEGVEWLGHIITFIQADFNEKIPSPDQTFDIAFTDSSLIYAKDPVKALKEMKRVAGKVILYEWKTLMEVL